MSDTMTSKERVSDELLRDIRTSVAGRGDDFIISLVLRIIDELLERRAAETSVDRICQCGKRWGDHPAQPPWWPCMLKSPEKTPAALTEDQFAQTAGRYEKSLNELHRKIEELEREICGLIRKNARLTRDSALKTAAEVPQTSNLRSQPNDRDRKVEGDHGLLPCRFCGCPAELWQRWEVGDIWYSYGACTNLEDVDGEPCTFHLPDDVGFYKPRKVEAIRHWNLMMGPRGAGETTREPHPDCATPVSDERLREILVSFVSALQQKAPKEHNIDMEWNEGLSILREVIAGRAAKTEAKPK
jgi:hypothetical protein